MDTSGLILCFSVLSTLCMKRSPFGVLISNDKNTNYEQKANINDTEVIDIDKYNLNFRDGYSVKDNAEQTHDAASYVDGAVPSDFIDDFFGESVADIDNDIKLGLRSVPVSGQQQELDDDDDLGVTSRSGDTGNNMVNRKYASNLFFYNYLMSKMSPLRLYKEYYTYRNHRNRNLDKRSSQDRANLQQIMAGNNDNIRHANHVTAAIDGVQNQIPLTVEVSKRGRRNRRPQQTPSCEIANVNMEFTFDQTLETESTGQMHLVCRESRRVNKCEGYCISKYLPNVNKYEGFSRECSCCKDVATTSMWFTFNNCQLDGIVVQGHSIRRRIIQPSECACSPCN